MIRAPLAARLGAWTAAFDPASAPDAARRAGRRAALDGIAVMAAGRAHAAVQRFSAALAEEPAGRAPLISGGRASAETAALINGLAAHAWDFDDVSYCGIQHGTALILPTVLALATERGASETAAEAAFLCGSEVAYALGDALGERHYLAGWWSTATFGLIGATAAAARMLDLPAPQSGAAIGLAASAAGVGKAAFGSHAKPFLVGDAARRAIGFARMAAAGLSAPLDAFEDPAGFFALLGDGASPDVAIDGRWRIADPGLLLKRHPVCSAAHAAIDLAAALLAEAGVTSAEVAQVETEASEVVVRSLRHPAPTTPEEAQFSLPFALACALRHGSVRLEDVSPDALQDAETRRLMALVSLKTAADFETPARRAAAPEGARMLITLRDGRRLVGARDQAEGMPGRPLSDRDLAEKLARCVRFGGLPAPPTDALALGPVALLRALLDASPPS